MSSFCKVIIPNIVAIVVIVSFWSTAEATSYLTYTRDLLSTSAPAASANQTVTFTLAQAIPAGGAVELDFTGGGLTVPASGFNYQDVDIGVSAVRGGPYTQRRIAAVVTVVTDSVTYAAGVDGWVRIDLNTTTGIPAGNEIEIRLGSHASYNDIGDTPMVLTAATGSYPITIRTYDNTDAELDYGRTMVAVVEQVTAGPVDTTDQTPPVILEAAPLGLLQVGTRAVEMYVRTDELSTCRYATSSMLYALMPYEFYGTSSIGLDEWHFALVSGLEDDTTYTYFVRCADFRLNENDPDFEMTFTIGIQPGSSSSTATTTGTGTGTGSSTASSTCTGANCTGTGTGSGSGGSGSGSGSSPGGGNGAGSGGGGGGSSGRGDKLPQADVRIDGWAYPGSEVSFIRDGVLVTTDAAGGSGEFSHLTTGLDRGSYTFGVFAVDTMGVRSATYSTTLWLRSETLNVLSNIMLPPTVAVPSPSIQPGDTLAVSGYSAPHAIVTTWLRPRLAQVSTSDIVSTTTAASNGVWAHTISTTDLPTGTYELVAQGAMSDGLIESDKSARMTIGVGVDVGDATCLGIGDLNCDGYVNLVDFSILLFNWNTDAAVADINGDGVVSLPDFSIMLYNWTG